MRARRGVGLVLVLWIIVILGGITASVVRAARTSTSIAANARAEVIARAAAESGIEAVVAAIEDTLSRFADAGARRDWLNTLATIPARDSFMLGDGRFFVAIVDVSARLDINQATEPALRVFFSQFTDPAEAATIASAIRRRIDPGGATRESSGALQPLSVTPLRSLEQLRLEGLAPARVLERSAQYLTVDGDGSINARTAPDTVRVAAAGELRDEPTRLLLISRGWLSGHPMTSEIQAVFSISGSRLAFSHWRERWL